jgi:hypothetical protein
MMRAFFFRFGHLEMAKLVVQATVRRVVQDNGAPSHFHALRQGSVRAPAPHGISFRDDFGVILNLERKKHQTKLFTFFQHTETELSDRRFDTERCDEREKTKMNLWILVARRRAGVSQGRVRRRAVAIGEAGRVLGAQNGVLVRETIILDTLSEIQGKHSERQSE